MRTLNARPIDALEAEHLALVKQCGCVFCGRYVPTEAHHPKGFQGLHFCAISACPDCHTAHVWNFSGITEQEAMNETNRRVAMLKSGHAIGDQPAKRVLKRGGNLSSPKQLPRVA